MRPKVNFVLVVLALVSLFVIVDAIAHHPLAAVWPRVLGAFAFSGICLVATGEREWLDIFLMVVAAVLTMFAIVTAMAVQTHPELWLLLIELLAAATIAVLFTRQKRHALMAIGAIVGFRLLLAGLIALRR